MTIYGIEIVHPHSFEVSRGQALTLLRHAVEGYSSGRASEWTQKTLKEKVESVQIATGYTRLEIQDVNYELRAELTY